MAIVINGSGTLSGLAVGGLPDGTVDSGTLATDSVVTGKIADGTIANADIADLAASKLTGALPAISGASLTGFTDAQMPAGSVLQVVQATTSTKTSTTSTSFSDTGLTATITPSSSSNKILILVSASCYNATSSTGVLRLTRNSDTNRKDFGYPAAYSDEMMLNYVPVHYLDEPSTTSATSYKMQHKRTGGSGAFYSNYNDGGGTMPSFITLLEIAG